MNTVSKKENVVEEKHRETTVEFLASLAAVLVTGLFIITFVLQAFEIPSSSMEETLLIGDHVFVNREQFAPKTPWIGPIIPYRDNFPAVPPSEAFNVTPEWQLLVRSHIQGDDIVVPKNSYFGMGDNRDVSLDSRYWGFIPQENVIGRPMFVYWSFNTPADQYRHTDFTERIGFLVHVVLHFFDETRWRRTFRVVK